MANPPKDNPLAAGGACALYYFPEIPCRGGSDRPGSVGRGQFVGGAFEHKGEALPAGQDLRNSPQVRCLMEEAFDGGREQGRAEALADSREKVDHAVQALAAAREELERVRRQERRCMETETVRLALAIAKKIIGHESRTGEMVAQVVKSAMRKVADPRNLVLKLNPDDIDTIDARRREWLAGEDAGTVVRLEADEAIQRGGCIIETQLGDVDARIDSQLKIIEALLVDRLPEPERHA
ncbi:MAG TPA: FliH/SctL family protein [Desulfosarcina sp.]|nr:FliH/SctL family protein [Desulfosarcina sp.]